LPALRSKSLISFSGRGQQSRPTRTFQQSDERSEGLERFWIPKSLPLYTSVGWGSNIKTWGHASRKSQRDEKAQCPLQSRREKDGKPTLSQTWTVDEPVSAICVQSVDAHMSCSSHSDAQFAAFFIDPRAKWSTVQCCHFWQISVRRDVTRNSHGKSFSKTVAQSSFTGRESNGFARTRVRGEVTLSKSLLHLGQGPTGGKQGRPGRLPKPCPPTFTSRQQTGCQPESTGSELNRTRPNLDQMSTAHPLKGGQRVVNDPTAGSPTVTLLRLLLPLNAQVWESFQATLEAWASRGPVQIPH
jgi:hypothetical protein